MSTPADTAIGHATIPTTTSTAEAAPEVLLTRGCPKRSLAAVEAEFVDNNDIDGSAPTSSVLQSDYLIIDDDDNLSNKVDMAPEVVLTAQPPHPPLFKRTRYSSEPQLTASDYALLQPIIQPDSKRELGHQHNHGGHDHSSRTHPFTRRRSMADLIPASNHGAVVCFDEPEATAIYGEPIDSGSATLGMDVIGEEEQEHEQEDVALATKYPGSTRTSATKAPNDPSPFKDLGSDPMSTGRDNGKDRKNSISQIPATNRNSSSIFMPTSHVHTHSVTRPHLRRNSSANSNKEPPRPVRIQLLDQAESEMIMQKAQQNASPSSSSWDQDLQPSRDQDQDLRKGDDAAIALPREDPIVHDWDEEELQDEDSECDSISFVAEPDQSQAPSLAPMSTRRQSIVDSIRGDVDRNSEGKSLAREGVRDTDNDNDDDEDDEDDDKDSLRDPEREVAMMSEDQEADLHNTHLRWENRREFQDAAGLDLGEDDSQAINEDGRYGGTIEDDDEGEDYWENR